MHCLKPIPRVLKRYFYHCDISEGGTFYSARLDAFVPLSDPFLVRPSDVRRLRFQLKRNWVPRGFFRPVSAPNILTAHRWFTMNGRKLYSLWMKRNQILDRGEPLVISPEFGSASSIIGVRFGESLGGLERRPATTGSDAKILPLRHRRD